MWKRIEKCLLRQNYAQEYDMSILLRSYDGKNVPEQLQQQTVELVEKREHLCSCSIDRIAGGIDNPKIRYLTKEVVSSIEASLLTELMSPAIDAAALSSVSQGFITSAFANLKINKTPTFQPSHSAELEDLDTFAYDHLLQVHLLNLKRMFRQTGSSNLGESPDSNMKRLVIGLRRLKSDLEYCTSLLDSVVK
ncbi:hypothetical protein NPIL_232922 [Nephila pilipes]|nr:hypothetical protein NPIL_232922 [Nephila pilipes]